MPTSSLHQDVCRKEKPCFKWKIWLSFLDCISFLSLICVLEAALEQRPQNLHFPATGKILNALFGQIKWPHEDSQNVHELRKSWSVIGVCVSQHLGGILCQKSILTSLSVCVYGGGCGCCGCRGWLWRLLLCWLQMVARWFCWVAVDRLLHCWPAHKYHSRRNMETSGKHPNPKKWNFSI